MGFLRKLFLVLASLVFSTGVIAAQFSGSQTDSDTWTYTLTFDPQDNYVCPNTTTTITVSGLTGVTAAAGPTSTDFPTAYLNDGNLEWTAQVSAGGTEVVWTAPNFGTGNMPNTHKVFGFTITADAYSGSVPFVTDGFAVDGASCIDRDASGDVAGPSVPIPSPVPAFPLFWLVIFVSVLGVLGLQKLKK